MRTIQPHHQSGERAHMVGYDIVASPYCSIAFEDPIDQWRRQCCKSIQRHICYQNMISHPRLFLRLQWTIGKEKNQCLHQCIPLTCGELSNLALHLFSYQQLFFWLHPLQECRIQMDVPNNKKIVRCIDFYDSYVGRKQIGFDLHLLVAQAC